MKLTDKFIQTITATICGIIGFLYGKADGLIYSLLAFIILDYVTGLTVACINKNLSSEVGFKGIAKKVVILLLVAVGNIVDIYIIGDGAACRSTVIGFYLANEGISILENAGNLGIPLPKKLVEVLKQLKNDNDKE